MKKTVFFLLLLSVVSCAFAQDVIVRTDGSTILCRVVSVGSDQVYYKKWSNLKGTTYTISTLTDEGLKSQFTSGSVSQKQGEKIMYTIPALPGSSGSPVINGKKQLVAINFAGLSGAQNFNYGIRIKYLRDLLDSQ